MDTLALLDHARSLGLLVSLSDAGEVKIKGNKTQEAMAVIEEMRAHKPLIISLLTPLAPASATKQPTPAQPDQIDITDYVGATVDPDTWLWLQAEVQRRSGETWQLHAKEVDGSYHIFRLTAR